MSSTLSEQVAELEAERNEYRAERESEERRGDLLRQAYEDSVAERDQLKRQVEAWENAERQATRVPHIITADELKVGQCIAFSVSDRHTGSTVWNVEHYAEGDRFPSDQLLTIVLLEDAPTEEPEPVKVGDTVRTVAELDGLAHGSVVLDYFGDAHQKGDGKWWETAHPEWRDSVDVARYAPFTVLYLPEEDA